MGKSKRSNYLIDKSFQLGFIARFLVVIIIAVLFCFIAAAFYYYQESWLGSSKLNESLTVSKKMHKETSNGDKLYNYDEQTIQIYETFESGKIVYRVYNPYNNENYKKDDIVTVSKEQLEPVMGAVTFSTTRFNIIIFPLLWTSLAIVILISVYSIFFSHRMAGPVYRMRVSLDRMLAGDYDFKIRVRKKDFFINIVDKLEKLRLQYKNRND